MSAEQPLQPIAADDHGVMRFRENAIVVHLLDHGAIDMNALAMLEFDDADWRQFAQLIGYSVSGYGGLSYAKGHASVDVADAIAAGGDAPRPWLDLGYSTGDLNAWHRVMSDPKATDAERLAAHGKHAAFDIRAKTGAMAVVVECFDKLAAPSAEPEQNGYVRVVDVEKLLCAKLGRDWSATGISIASLIDALARHLAPADEDVAKLVYEAMKLDQPKWKPWVERGNSHAQDEARRIARAIRALPRAPDRPDERAAFEEVLQRIDPRYDLETYTTNGAVGYVVEEIDLAWEVWLAARTQPLAPADSAALNQAWKNGHAVGLEEAVQEQALEPRPAPDEPDGPIAAKWKRYFAATAPDEPAYIVPSQAAANLMAQTFGGTKVEVVEVLTTLYETAWSGGAVASTNHALPKDVFPDGLAAHEKATIDTAFAALIDTAGERKVWFTDPVVESLDEKLDQRSFVDTAGPSADPVVEKYDDTLLPFLALMRAELHANSRKGDRPGWLTMTRDRGLLEIYWHTAKLSVAVRDGKTEAIREHAADVANMAMMLADVCGALATHPPIPASLPESAEPWRKGAFENFLRTEKDMTEVQIAAAVAEQFPETPKGAEQPARQTVSGADSEDDEAESRIEAADKAYQAAYAEHQPGEHQPSHNAGLAAVLALATVDTAGPSAEPSEGRWQAIDDEDLSKAEKLLLGSLPRKASWLPVDANYLANIALHCIREVKATRAAPQPVHAEPDEPAAVAEALTFKQYWDLHKPKAVPDATYDDRFLRVYAEEHARAAWSVAITQQAPTAGQED